MIRTTWPGKNRCTLILLVLLFFVFLSCPTKAAEDIPARSVAILPFTLHAGENLAYLQDGLRDMLASRLAANAGVAIVERSKIEALVQAPGPVLQQQEAQALARALEADFLISGSLTSLGGAISIDATVFSADPAVKNLSFYASAAQENETISAITKLSWDIAERVFGKTPPGQAPQPVTRQPATTTQDPTMEAFKTEHPERALRAQGSGQTLPTGSPFITKQSITGAETFTKTRNFEFAIRAMDVYDIDQDGQADLVLAGADGVHVILMKGSGLQEIALLPLSAVQKAHGISVADLNGNGQAEIYVSTEYQGGPNSFGVEWQDGSFVPLFEKASWYIRVLDLPGEGPTLLGQKGQRLAGRDSPGLGSEEANPIIPGIFRLRLSGDTLESGEKLVLPASVNLFDFAMADLNNDGASEIIVLTQEDRLQVHDTSGRRLWQSSEYYGGSSRYIGELESSMGAQYQTEEIRGTRVYIPGRIIITDLNGDNQPEVITIRNISTASRVLGYYQSYSSSEIHALSWNGIALGELWRTRKIDGYAVDIQLMQQEKEQGKTAVLYAGVVLKGGGLDILSSKESTVLMYTLSGKGTAEK